ncbi:family 20 glycosylhydrolase [Enterococcus sp. AZ163]|uniref:family 20 glycosylhydrolase n=1 Tax=Enterococcus sp. AZ163 TaxID=2774638 RepID=UPI003D28AEE3
MEKIKCTLLAETKVTQEVQHRVTKLFVELGYYFVNDQENTFCLQIDSELGMKAKLESTRILGGNPAILFRGAVRVILSQLMENNWPEILQPQLEERIVMLDIGRKYYPLVELKRLVRSMALFQFTHLQLHFSENEGFGIESLRYPEIVSAEHLTQAEIKELIAYAKQYYLELIPDLDSPGHLQQVLRHYPQWQLPMKDSERDTKAVDILNPEATAFIHAIYQEFAELFYESRYFHIGADEFVDFDLLENYPELKKAASKHFGKSASGIETFISYINDLAAYVKGLGFTVRVWNDGFYRSNRQEQVHLTQDCEISYWTRWNQHMAPIEKYFEKNYSVINHNDNFFYYVLGEAAGYSYPTYEKINAEFQLTTFANGQRVINLTQTKGIAISVWADVPEAKQSREVINDIFWLQAALSEKVYGDKQKKTDYQKLYDSWSA